MGYANAHRQISKDAQPQRKTAMPDKKELKCPSFMGLMACERILLVAHPSWLNYIFSLALGSLFLLFAIVLICSNANIAVAISQATVLSFWGLIFLLYVTVKVLSNVAIVTNYRVITKNGILSTRVSEIRIVDIRGMGQSRGIWQSIIGVSNLGIGTAATGGTEIKIIGITNANAVIALINTLRPSV